jgi:hypothetical protein
MRILFCLLCASLASAQSPAPPRVIPFDLRDVRLLESPFAHARDRDRDYLLSLKPARLLARTRIAAGLVPADSSYGGWEKEGLSSHFVGHYLSACSIEYRASGDSAFLRRVNETVDGLAECQAANGDGYVGGMPGGKKVFAEVASGSIRTRSFDLNGLWSPWYTLHKIMAGLRDAHRLCGNQKALSVLSGMCSWACDVTSRLSDEQFQHMLACEYGGMSEVLGDAYVLTGQEKFLSLALRFASDTVLTPLARGEDRLKGLHGNTIIPKLIGAARLYEITGDERLHAMSRFFWETVTRNHTYVAGGHGENEYFGPPGMLNERLSESTMETCNTYNMLKLTRFLFGQSPEPAYADFYERGLYNHILASQNPDDGMVCYFVPLGTGTYKTYSTPEDDCTCCLGTGMENHVKYGDAIYFHDRDTLTVNLFIASELTWHEKGVRITQATRFPDAPVTSFRFACTAPVRIPVKIRQPFWTAGPVHITLNGVPLQSSGVQPGYCTVERVWKTGDRIDVTFPMSLRLESMPDNPQREAVFYGPVLLAADLGPIDSAWAAPALVTEQKDVSGWVKKEGDSLLFVTNRVGRPSDLTLLPFFRTHHRRHAVYFDLYTARGWDARQNEVFAETARMKDLEGRTVDRLQLGDTLQERAHNLESDRSFTGEYRGRKWRQAGDGGWFSFSQRFAQGVPAELVVTYWGSDAGKREFDVSIDGSRIATQVLERIKPGEFADVNYPIPDALLVGKQEIKVSFTAHHATTAGRVFECRVAKRNPVPGR